MAYRGLTWDHPRGQHALLAAADQARASGLEIAWDAQPLEGFESTPIAELAETYDLIVLDHPHLGEAVATDALRPLDPLLPDHLLDEWARVSVGPSFRSYRLDGRQWAVPLDAATQVAAYRTDLTEPVPVTWDEVEQLSRRQPVALSLAGPHALLTFASICAALGEPLDSGTPELIGDQTANRAWELLTLIGARAPALTTHMNPIALLSHMRDSDEVAYCPLVYGYVNYSGARLRFADAPRVTPGGPVGSTIGGTGLAFSRRCEPSRELLAHVAWLMSESAQLHFIPEHDGQPSRRDAWTSAALNHGTSDFYRGTLNTIDGSWVRPRGAGYISFQSAGAEVVRDVVARRVNPADGIEALRRAARDTGLTPVRQEAL
jgi:multiple sugar transport system substrate-binding protein